MFAAAGILLQMRPEPPLWQQYLVIVGGFALLAALTPFMPSYWRRPNKNLQVVPVLWVWSDAMWRGFQRAVPTVYVLMAITMTMLTYMFIVGRERVNYIIFWSFVTILMAGTACLFSIAFFNQPKFLVPPYLRHEPGAIVDIGRRDRLLIVGFIAGFLMIFISPLLINLMVGR